MCLQSKANTGCQISILLLTLPFAIVENENTCTFRRTVFAGAGRLRRGGDLWFFGRVLRAHIHQCLKCGFSFALSSLSYAPLSSQRQPIPAGSWNVSTVRSTFMTPVYDLLYIRKDKSQARIFTPTIQARSADLRPLTAKIEICMPIAKI
jgi:hypothetical protein